MIRHVKFPSIEQYRNVITTVTNRTRYIGQDENDNPVFDPTLPLPTLRFQGSVKLHGTNAAVARDVDGNTWPQSRTNILTLQDDNAGFAMFVHANHNLFDQMLQQALLIKPLSGEEVILIFGEWCGGSIQKKVALSQFPKMFVVFGIARTDAEGQKEWFTKEQINQVLTSVDLGEAPVHHIFQFPHYEVEIDFNNPAATQQKLIDMTVAVENECPVGKQLGATAENGSMIGEGIVWQCVTPGYDNSGYWFKVKGEAHKNVSKDRTRSPQDLDRLALINQLAEEVTPEWRLEQMMQETFNTLNGGQPDIKRMGDYIKAVMVDVLKEESDTVAASGFSTREITGSISKIARDYLMTQMEIK
jgi:hypothetical protein